MVLACPVPGTGEKYDSLINITHSSHTNDIEYQVSAPERIEDAKFDSALIHIQNNNGEDLLDIPINMKSNNGDVVGVLYLYEHLNLNVYISVWWSFENSDCPIIGKASLKHNNSLKRDRQKTAAP